MGPPTSKLLQCSYCAKHFGRAEHLKRHELIHTKERHFTCSVCSKEFMRRDALQRHEATHQITSPNLLSKGARACTQCAAAKARCSGEPQCARCLRRGETCTYPDGQSVTTMTPPAQDFNAGQSSSSTAIQWNDQRRSGQPSTQALGLQQFNHISAQIPMPYPADGFDPDFWDPSILSTSNWLDAVVDSEFPGLAIDFQFADSANQVHRQGIEIAYPSWTTSTSEQGNVSTLETTFQSHVRAPPTLSSAMSDHSAVPAAEITAAVCAAEENPPQEVGEYYADGEPARLPRTKRRKLSPISSIAEPPAQPNFQYPFSLRIPLPLNANLRHRVEIPIDAYETFYKMWQCSCLENAFPWPSFEPTDFPPKELFDHLLGLYFAYFHKTLPFLHPASFKPMERHWLLILAMTSIGAYYLYKDYSSLFAVSLQELLRRSLIYIREDINWIAPSELVTAQIRILHSVGLVYSGLDKHVKYALAMQQDLADSYGKLMIELRSSQTSQERTSESIESEWRAWIARERMNRTVYSLWLLDCMWSYQFQVRPLLGLSGTTASLPCHEKLWSPASSAEWKNCGEISKTPGLQEALQHIYIDKRLPRDWGEFARVLIIHGLFQRAWEVEHYFSNPMSLWEPTAQKQSSMAILMPQPVWSLSIPTVMKWQNSVCDCLDILHWQANATIGQASGLEHPTVAFLHLARVVLLSPINRIVGLARAMAGAPAASNVEISTEKQTLQRWAKQGQYKARLAAIHAGVALWHIRRYSVDGFYEAPTVALAALMLWAFAAFSPKLQSTPNGEDVDRTTAEPPQQDESVANDETNDDSCPIILLDRPTDDELVQQFIRKGQTMRAHITGVGDLFGAHGPERVLVEGCKLLSELRCWGVCASWMELLRKLADSYKNGNSA